MTTVLLVEDDPAARQGLELALRRLGYGVRAAATGEAALDGLGEGAVDVVVLDVMLPGLDGFEVCRRLRRDSDVPVIMLTARGDDFDIVGGPGGRGRRLRGQAGGAAGARRADPGGAAPDGPGRLASGDLRRPGDRPRLADRAAGRPRGAR